MNWLVVNILLAIGWSALWGEVSAPNLLAGFVLGFFGLWFARGLLGRDERVRYFEAVAQTLYLLVYFLKELVKSCLMVARDCVARHPNLHPAIVRMQIGPKSDLEIFVLSSLITLTPGTLTLDVAEDRSYLVIHSIYAEDPEALVADLKSGMEHRVNEVFRR